MIALNCQHKNSKKNGRDAKGNQRFKCLDCDKTFIDRSGRILGNSRLPEDRAVLCLKMLLEGMSISAVSRLTGTDKNTIINLIVEIGERCQQYFETEMQGLAVSDVECDETWGFIQCKERTRERLGKNMQFGDCYTFTAVERNTKLLITWHCGKRSSEDTQMFTRKLNDATTGRFQISTDGFGPYLPAIPETFRGRVSHGQLIKNYGTSESVEQRRYSPPRITSCEKKVGSGNPDMNQVSTSIIERSNLTWRMHVRRMTRLTNAHSKTLRNHEAMLALNFMWYNFARPHMSLNRKGGQKRTPAMAAGLTDHVWSFREMLEAIATF